MELEPVSLGWQAWYTLAAIAVMLVALVRGVARTDLILLGTLGLLLVAGVLTPEQAFGGFANPAVIAIAALFVVAAGVERTGALGALDGLLRPRSDRPTPALLRLFVPVAVMSAVLNNTPIVAMFIPRVQAWAEKTGLPVSKILIPLSTAAIVGGWLTLIGTSTNVVVHGLLLAEGLPGFGFFDLTWVGVPAVLIVALYYAFIGHRLLPDRSGGAIQGRLRDYQFDVRVAADAPFAGQTIEAAGLRTLGDAYLAHIGRAESVVDAVPETVLLPGDVLTFVGGPQVHDLLLQRPGMERTVPTVATTGQPELPLYEAVVAPGSRLVGQTLKEVGFRERYGGIVLAVQRRDETVGGGLGSVRFRPGDLLLIEGRRGLEGRLAVRSEDFALVTALDHARPVGRRAPLALAILIGMIGLVVLEVLPLAAAAFAAALGMVVTGCLRGPAVMRAVDAPVLLVIASALGLGQAVEVTGLAMAASHGVIGLSAWTGPVVMLAFVYLAANLLAELITNKASAVLMLPVALAVAADLGADWKPFAVAVAVGSAASFLTPIGYQTNLMVMGPGGYRYTDFTRAGAPVSLLVFITTVTVCAFHWL